MSSLFAKIDPPLASQVAVVIVALIALAGLVACLVCATYFNLWIQAKLTGASVGIFELIGMSFRKVNPNIIVRSKIMAFQAGLTEQDGVTTRSLEAHDLAGGNVSNVVRALIAARGAGQPMSFEQAAALDLSEAQGEAGRALAASRPPA